MNYKTKLDLILEQSDSEDGIILPPIPAASVRLTHFTSPQVATLILNGDNFKYSDLNSTTDSFSDNRDVVSLIKTGKTGPFSRDEFGPCIVLMDVSNLEHRILRQPRSPGFIDNSRIVGVYLKRDRRLIPNPNYNPSKDVDMNLGPQIRLRNRPSL